MKYFGTVKSTVKPESLAIDAFSVWVADNIREVSEDRFTGFSYTLLQYGKDEYIKLLSEQGLLLENQLTDTQLALTEIYENMGV